jgi:GNAT superfamily N-acetyltransferase
VRYASEALAERHLLAHFDSGRPDLDRWLREAAATVEAMRTGRTFVWADEGRVMAYYTIAAHLLARDDVPRAVGRGSPGQIPAVRLARLALDKTLHGRGLGGVLLADALGRVVDATQVVAARLVVVDAVDEPAVRFYEHYGFRRVPDTTRLVQKVSDIAAALAG